MLLRGIATLWIGLLMTTLASPAAALNPGLFINPFEERALGVSAHQANLAKRGGVYPNAAIAHYVSDFGMRIAQQVAKHPDQFVITLVNQPDMNASTTFGGFIYINAGALVWMSDEAELGALIGHEVGHAIKRHPAHSYNRRNVAGGMLRLSALSSQNRANWNNVKMQFATTVQAYEQNDEFEADEVGLITDGKLGLDTLGAARVFDKFQLMDRWYQAQGYGSDKTPPFLQDHPQSLDRLRRAVELAESSEGTDYPANADRYLAMINGMRIVMAKNVVRYVRVVTVKPGDTAQSLSRRVAMPSPLAYFLAINGLSDPTQLKPGARVKLVTKA